MREPAEREEIRKDVILQKCFNVLTENGVEGATIRNFSDATGMTASSLYYWFEDKDDIVIDATIYGLNYIVEMLFDYAIEHIDNIDELCNGFVEYISNYKSQIRLVFQVATSPIYGSKVRGHIKNISLLYDAYAKKISTHFDITYNTLRILVDNFISAIVDYVIWEDLSKIRRQMNYIAEVVKGGESS